MANSDQHHNAKVLTGETMNRNFMQISYSIRGASMVRSIELQKELAQGVKKPFSKVIKANVGDSQALGQKPLTFMRQMLMLCANPELFKSDDIPADAKRRAKHLLGGFYGPSIGCYTDGTGIEVLRRDIAAFIQRRDGVPSDYRKIFFVAGAAEAMEDVIQLVLTAPGEKPAGIMVPRPEFPLYAAFISKLGAYKIAYYLDEDRNWGLDVAELQRALNEAKENSVPRLLCVINPGNPTGQVLSMENMKDVIRFAHDHRLVILADEVYQENVYFGTEFHSFKKVVSMMEPPYCNTELVSVHSASKGCVGECGLRGGYIELVNFEPIVYEALGKYYPTKHPSTMGQIALDVVVNPPSPGEPSHERFMQEKKAIFESHEQRAKLITELFNSIEGLRCSPITGALYAFPRVFIPERAVAEAQKLGMEPDAFYCLQLLEETGIAVVPGSGFGQRQGTHHFRTTLLPQMDVLRELVARFRVFHTTFLQQWK